MSMYGNIAKEQVLNEAKDKSRIEAAKSYVYTIYHHLYK